jgi:hypothetical protein
MDKIDDPITPEANQKNGSSAAGKKDPAAAQGDAPAAAQGENAAPERAERPDTTELRPSFLSELAEAMRATAQRERDRIASVVADDAAAHVDKVRARAAIETEELRRLAEEDVQHIEEWSASEIDRIRAEAEQRISDRRASLDEYLQQHDSIIDTEIQGVDAAVLEYNATLDRFFEELSEAGDPAAIVERAESLPPAPDLDQVRAKARASAVAMFADEEAPSSASGTAGPSEPGAGEQAATAGSDAVGLIGDTPAASEAGIGIATDQGDGSDGTAEGDRPSASTEPVPVMDANASSESSWPPAQSLTETGADGESGSEPSELSPTADHTSAAVRLLRSVAPWTAPTHAGSDRRDADSE